MTTMPELFVLGRAKKPVVSETRLEQLFNNLKAILSDVPGFLSATVWQGQTNPDAYLLFTHYESQESALDGLDKIMQSEFLSDVTQSFLSPIDIRRVVASFQVGQKPGEIQNDAYLSVSNRTAEPGHGPDLIVELQGICTELMAIEGCVGALGGAVDTLEEEVVSVVFWETQDAFAASLPKKVLYDVQLYQRVF